MKSLKGISNAELINQLKKLVSQEQDLTLQIIFHLAEVERRGLYLEMAYSTLFEYCRSEFGYSDASAWRRSSAAIAILKCPEAWDMLRQRRVSISVLCQISKVITPELLRQVVGKAKSDVELLIAALNPKSAHPDRSRPVMVPKTMPAQHEKPTAGEASHEIIASVPGDHSHSLRREVNVTNVKLSFEQKYRLEGVVSKRVHEKLERCKTLLSRKYPEGVDYDTLFDELTEIFLNRRDPDRRVDRKKPHAKRAHANSGDTRHISIKVKNLVWKRDNGRCTFVGSNGKRCSSEFNLQFDHYPIPYARGGPSTVDNLRLLCAKHNKYTAEIKYGRQHIEKYHAKESPGVYRTGVGPPVVIPVDYTGHCRGIRSSLFPA